jgi:hypothetical protein
MSDRTYTRFTIPLSILADPARSVAVRCIFGLTTTEFQRIILAQPETDEAAGYEGTTVRLVDGRPCLVYEDPNCNYGGTHIEDELTKAGIPFLQVNGAGSEYGPTATVFDGQDTETIRLDHDLDPVVGIGRKDGVVVADPGEVADFLRYDCLRSRTLLWPAAAA